MAIAKLKTNGRGYWSKDERIVDVTKIRMSEYNEMRVYFTRKSWNVEKHGLIYTDPLWIKELRQWFANRLWLSRVTPAQLDYSEQGMQGDNYVSLDVSESFQNIIWKKALDL